MKLIRTDYSSKGTFGRIGRWFTVERPWLNNQLRVSCIPVGTYKVIWTPSPRLHRSTYRLLGTEPRSGILIHSANLPTQLEGCIALGEKEGLMDGQRCVLLSKPAVRAFEDFMGRQPFTLEICDA